MTELFSKVLIVGPGRVGSTLQEFFSSGEAPIPVRMLKRADLHSVEIKPHTLLLLTVPDDEIQKVVDVICAVSTSYRLSAAIHTSGATPLAVLKGLEQRGAKIGVLHPCFSIPETMSTLTERLFTFEGDQALGSFFEARLKEVGARCLKLPECNRLLYHAALVFSAGHLVSLLALAEETLRDAGISPEISRELVQSVSHSAQTNYQNLNLENFIGRILTGPFARGDQKLIAAEVQELQKKSPQAAEIFSKLGEVSQKLKT